MQYHRNATTNVNQRAIIRESQESARELAKKYEVSHTLAPSGKNQSK
jgi:hypothetical protein